MSPLVLTPAQEELLKDAPSSVPVQNSEGKIIGAVIVEAFEPGEPVHLSIEEIEELARRMSMKDVRWFTTAEVLARLDELDAEPAQ